MSIWVLVLFGPVAALLAGYAVIKTFSLLSQLDADRFIRLINVSERATMVVLSLAAVGAIAAFFSLWQLSPWWASFMLLVLVANGTLAWTVLRRRGPIESDLD